MTTTKGQYRAKKLIVSAGAYVLELMKELSLPWKVELKGLCWLEPQKGFEPLFKPEKLPVFRLVDTKKKIKIGGFPDMMGTGVKTPIRTKKSQKMTNLCQLDREVEGKEEKTVNEKITTYMPKVFGRVNKVATCFPSRERKRRPGKPVLSPWVQVLSLHRRSSEGSCIVREIQV